MSIRMTPIQKINSIVSARTILELSFSISLVKKMVIFQGRSLVARYGGYLLDSRLTVPIEFDMFLKFFSSIL